MRAYHKNGTFRRGTDCCRHQRTERSRPRGRGQMKIAEYRRQRCIIFNIRLTLLAVVLVAAW